MGTAYSAAHSVLDLCRLRAKWYFSCGSAFMECGVSLNLKGRFAGLTSGVLWSSVRIGRTACFVTAFVVLMAAAIPLILLVVV